MLACIVPPIVILMTDCLVCLLQEEEDQSVAPNTANGTFQFAPATQTVPAGGFSF